MSLHNVPIGEKAPEKVNAIIEIPKGSQNKYEFDEKLGVIKLDRVLYSPFHYPVDYGFIPETRSEDGDHLDALVLGNDPLFSGCLVEIRPIGMLKMIDSGERDSKILSVPTKDPRFETIKDLADVEKYNPHLLKEIVHMFEHMKDLQGKKVEVEGWENAEVAKKEILDAMEMFKKESK
ncbi:MAG: inorganic diphosphatase [Patescibacteria group bacterium]